MDIQKKKRKKNVRSDSSTNRFISVIRHLYTRGLHAF